MNQKKLTSSISATAARNVGHSIIDDTALWKEVTRGPFDVRTETLGEMRNRFLDSFIAAVRRARENTLHELVFGTATPHDLLAKAETADSTEEKRAARMGVAQGVHLIEMLVSGEKDEVLSGRAVTRMDHEAKEAAFK